MALSPGVRLGPYTVRALIGRGGMGEVYRAHDARLGRDVALKVIGISVGHDAVMRRRFDAEAQLAASLDHPRICAIYDVGHSDGVDYLVMELLEGETLASRLRRGAVPLPQMLGYAIEIASALAYAHAHGIVHRDIKPGNIVLTASGVKVVDFGLAKLRQIEQASSSDIASLNTQKLPATERGVIHGTPEYMPPERLEGKEEDHRSDIFAFGVVLYEMATGRRAFEASSSAALIGAIMSTEPGPMAGHGTATPEFEWLVRRCLEKNPDTRWQSMSDAEAVLKRMASSPGRQEERASWRWLLAPRYVATAAGGVLVAAVLLLFGQSDRQEAREPQPSVALSIGPPPGGRFTMTNASSTSAQLAVSPDGHMLAFVASGADHIDQIWIRPLDSLDARPVPGTAGATYPFWSPNSRSLGFFADRQLWRVDLDGGPARFLADAPNGRGGSWSTANVILFAPLAGSPIFRVNADGTGTAEQTSFAPGEVSHRFPQFLPDGHHFLLFGRNPRQRSDGVYLASLDTPDRALLVPSAFSGVYAPPNHVLYVADGTLMARTLDLAHARLTGEPVAVVEGVAGPSNYYGAFSASANGVLAFARSAADGELVWMDRQGRTLSIASERANYVDFQISRDRRYLAMARTEPHNDHPDIRVRDLERGDTSRLTSSRATDASPVWAPDGTRVVFRSNRDRLHDLYIVAPNSAGSDELLLRTDAAKYPTDWSTDGRMVIYHSEMRETGWDIWAAGVSPRGQPTPLVRTTDDEVQGHLSRNGRWLAYTSRVPPDTVEVFAKALNGGATRVPISVNGGSDPHWSADDRELFYVGPDGTLMSVAVHPEGPLNPEKPRPLFKIPGVRVAPPYPSRYDVDPSGQRFLVLRPIDNPQTVPLTEFVNWSPRSSRN
jgi:eukaryotic-like serine/threonine-protein kinase